MASRGPQQFRTRINLIEAQRMRTKSNKSKAKSTKLINILPLITVWSQVRALPIPSQYVLLVISAPETHHSLSAVRHHPHASERAERERLSLSSGRWPDTGNTSARSALNTSV